MINVTLDATPAGQGLTVSLDGGPSFATPHTYQLIQGSLHTVATTATQNGATGVRYIWQTWSDGGTISHSLNAPSIDTTYTAGFKTQYLLTTASANPTGGGISPSTNYVDAGPVQVTATPNAGYAFSKFTGDLTGSLTPQSLMMNGPKTVTANFVQIVSGQQATIVQSGLGRNRATGLWASTLTVTNTGAVNLSGSLQVVLTSLTVGVTLVNNTGTYNASPYITVSTGPLAPGASASVTLLFSNPSNGFINFTPLAYGGGF